jgi:hypothetical protein
MGHPSTRALCRFLRLAQPNNRVTEADVAKLKDNIASCLVCDHFGPGPRRGRAGLSFEALYNFAVALDIVNLHGLSCVLMVCLGTTFRAAAFTSGETSGELFEVFHNNWVTKYGGAPKFVVVDQAQNLQSAEFQGLCAEMGVTIIDKGVEAHSSLGSGERFHKSLRETWDKCALESRNRNLSADALLSLEVFFSLNAVPDSSGRSSSLMVFGQVPPRIYTLRRS